MVPEVFVEASVVTVKGVARSGRWRMVLDRKRDLRVLDEVWQAGDQFQGRLFLVRSIRGWVTLE